MSDDQPFASPALEPRPEEEAPTQDQQKKDKQHLDLLVIFHYVVAAFSLFGVVFPIFHLGFGITMLVNPGLMADPGAGQSAPDDLASVRMMGMFFICLAALMMIFSLAMALAIFSGGRSIRARRRYTWCLVVAAMCCLLFPYGTALGIFTIIVLIRPSVKWEFQQQSSQPAL